MANRRSKIKQQKAFITVDEATERVSQILAKISTEDYHDFAQFLYQLADEISHPTGEEEVKEKTLNEIRNFLREKLPPSATAPSEKIHLPTSFSSCTPQNTQHVDSFLFPDDEVIDEYCDKGLLSRYYCKECSSRNVLPLEFISHSMSAIEAKVIFTHILPNLAGKIVLDIGSRLGTVLYCGSLYSKAFSLIGVEFNKELADLQIETIKKFGLNRIKIICDDICNCAKVIGDADIIIMNNVFDAFIQPEKLPKIWEFVLNSVVKPGAILVADPGLEKAMSNANISKEHQGALLQNFKEISISEKLEEIEDLDDEELDELCDLKVYERKK